jgi:hypothetical protein
LGRFQEAEQELVEAERVMRIALFPQHYLVDVINRLVALYEAWDAAEPGKGYVEKAAEWRAKLNDLEVR